VQLKKSHYSVTHRFLSSIYFISALTCIFSNTVTPLYPFWSIPFFYSIIDRGDSFYFLNPVRGGVEGVNRSGDYQGVEVNAPPLSRQTTASSTRTANTNSGGSGLFSFIGSLFGQGPGSRNSGRPGVSQLQRKVPVKIEPKVYFANERTFLAWLHMAVMLASVAVAICAFAEKNDFGLMYGLALMPVAIAFCVYALWLYVKRANMIRRKDPGPYEDRIGPTVLASLLGVAIVVNFAIKVFEMQT
jgi:uncharacterized membrane protein YidH (DUF202 family)